jgi:two-component system cell cycle response regulator
MSARVLVVDDILPNVKLLEAKLTSEYYDVLTATNGEEALQSVEQDSPDLILLDVMMPGMDGFEVCTRIKQNAALAHIPVVMVTALTDTEDKVRGLECGADDFLTKPINDTALMARVRSLVRLKMTTDEWRVRENTANQLGVLEGHSDVMSQSADRAKIMIIEDKDFEERKIIETLQEDENEIVSVSSGMELMEKIVAEPYDLLIISLNLEDEDGLRLCSHLRSNEKTRTTPILMIGEEQDMDRIAHGLEIGAHDYVLRPVERSELRARVRTQIRRKRFQERLKSSYEISLSMALTDSLTGLYNRRYLEAHLEKLLEKNRQDRKSLAVLMVDIDNFKSVNDTYGHNVGDEILKVFAQRLKDGLRPTDLIARLGGEEFTVILPDVTKERAHMVAERLRRNIAQDPITCSAPEGALNITTSIGGALIDYEPHTVAEALERADKMLYKAKEEGRNCCVFEHDGRLDPETIPVRERPLDED